MAATGFGKVSAEVSLSDRHRRLEYAMPPRAVPAGPSAPPSGRAALPRGGRHVPRGRRRTVWALLLACSLLGAAACEPAAPQDGKGPWASPFTGMPAHDGQVLAVKLDNARRARPHLGVEQADLVYFEKVEGGMSRLMGVYASRYPAAVGPVRSVRESDLELLAQFGRPALAYSGVRSDLRGEIERSPNQVVPPSVAPGAYFRDFDRPAPHHLFVDPREALRAAPQADRGGDIGFRFGPRPDGGRPTAQRSVRYSAAEVGFSWSDSGSRWLASFDGAPAMGGSGRRLGARTVVIQHVTMRPSRFTDFSGAVTPYIETVGRGRATVLRDGRAYETTWQRPAAGSGTSFTRPDGEPMPFAPGQVWVVYADR